MGIKSTYTSDEIKYNIDTAIQRSMFETNKWDWDVIEDVQSRLYKEFGIED